MEIPITENIPRNIPGVDVQKAQCFRGFAKNIPNIPNIPGMSGMRYPMRAKRYAHAWTLVHRMRLRGPFLAFALFAG